MLLINLKNVGTLSRFQHNTTGLSIQSMTSVLFCSIHNQGKSEGYEMFPCGNTVSAVLASLITSTAAVRIQVVAATDLSPVIKVLFWFYLHFSHSRFSCSTVTHILTRKWQFGFQDVWHASFVPQTTFVCLFGNLSVSQSHTVLCGGTEVSHTVSYSLILGTYIPYGDKQKSIWTQF